MIRRPPRSTQSRSSAASDVYKRQTIDNPSSTDPRLANRSDQYWSGGNTYWFRSSDYLRLKNVEIGYNIPSHLTEKIGVKNARFYVNGLNLITWSKNKVYDPESDSSLGQYYPQARAVSYTHLRAHETVLDLVCRLLLEKKKNTKPHKNKTLVIQQ
eukprot:TRINITY_DN27768_c0_g1_i1.p1 TRINITY_DN27768_c0_g1~~TRINITY_DN27768_c0_g1_i1.p1  ORF type:complete len:156 (-),score=28.45 TRINITY_DN27768_c0_g1_i1:52-519(-)